MVFIYVPHRNDGKKPAPREAALGLLVAALIALGFAIFVVTIGPKSGPPPPPIVFWALVGIFAIFALVAFFNWLKSQGEDDAASQDSDSGEEK
jgi:drug/metabolite transporter (DMT)-like permease